MQFQTVCISRSDELLNAARRINPARDALEEALERCELTTNRYQDVIFGVTDNPLVFYKEQKSKRGYVTIYVGVDPRLTFAPEDDDKFLLFLLDRIRHFAKRAKLSTDDAAVILKACDEVADKYSKKQE